MIKKLQYLTSVALLASSLTTHAQHQPVGITGIVLDAPITSVPRAVALKCETRLSAIDAPSAKDTIVRSLQRELQHAKARGNTTCFSKKEQIIGRLRTASLMVTTDYGRITGIYLQFAPSQEDTSAYNTNARLYITSLTEKRYGHSVGSTTKTSWERWSPLQYEQEWDLRAARIQIVDAPRRVLTMTFNSKSRFAPDNSMSAAIASIEKKIDAREQQLQNQMTKAAASAERNLFLSR